MRLWAGDDRHFRLARRGGGGGGRGLSTQSAIVKFTLWNSPFSLCSFF